MDAVNITLRLDRSLKEDAETLFADLGMSISTAFNIFLRKALRIQGLPFAVTRELPNSRTLQAMQEAERLALDDSAKTYSSAKELIQDALA